MTIPLRPAGGHTGFNVGPPMQDFMRDVQKTLVEQPDFRGIGGHDLQDHGSHGLHSQISIGMGNRTIDFRNIRR